MRRIAAMVVVLLALAGCGGGGGGGGSTLTKAQYLAKVNGLCLLSADAVREMHLTIQLADWQRYGHRIVLIGQRFTNKLAALTPPSEIADAAQSYLAENQKVLADNTSAVDAAQQGNLAGFQAALDQAGKDVLNSYVWARKMGAKGCYS